MKLGMYILVPEPIRTCTSYLSLITVCMCIPLFGARQRLGGNVTAATITRNKRKSAGRVIVCGVPGLPRESACLSMHPPIAAW
jgi:hypothetical protein